MSGTFPYHFHHANEELLVVLEGSVVVRRQDGEETLERGDAALFPQARRARTAPKPLGRPARVLMVSTHGPAGDPRVSRHGKVG